jgi:hypothetical protein
METYKDYFDYEALQRFKILYDTTETAVIKANITKLMRQHNCVHKNLTVILGISIHTAYSYTEIGKKNKPEELALLILAAKWKIEVQTLFEN